MQRADQPLGVKPRIERVLRAQCQQSIEFSLLIQRELSSAFQESLAIDDFHRFVFFI